MSRLRVSMLVLMVLVATLMLTVSPYAQDDNSIPVPPKQVVETKIITSEALYRYEITESVLAKTMVRRATERWAQNYGINQPERGLAVYNVGTADKPDILIVPTTLQIGEIVAKTYDDGTAEFDTNVTTNALKRGDASSKTESDAQPATTSSSGWELVQQHCYTRVEDSSGWIDSCYWIKKLSSDGKSTYDYYNIEHWATASSKSPYYLYRAYVAAERDLDSPPMYWVDWDKGSDLVYGSCTSTQLSAGNAAYGRRYDVCEEWDITKYADPGKFKNEWQGNSTGTVATERETAYMIAVKVPDGSFPIWVLSSGYQSDW